MLLFSETSLNGFCAPKKTHLVHEKEPHIQITVLTVITLTNKLCGSIAI